ncbi:MAG TPA: hypothetical protein VND65_01215, partial [Candidatus Binatia bacterium]|nr:hypothetical protein [Candidatus Binatia bacterium]
CNTGCAPTSTLCRRIPPDGGGEVHSSSVRTGGPFRKASQSTGANGPRSATTVPALLTASEAAKLPAVGD